MQTIMLNVGWKYLKLWKRVQFIIVIECESTILEKLIFFFSLFHDTFWTVHMYIKKKLFLWVFKEKPYYIWIWKSN